MSVPPVGISIVMPLYNIEKYVEQAILSILAQSFRDFELICVDDGSRDGTRDTVRTLAGKDNRITLLEQSNAGAGAARNNGLSRANGKYVMFLDGDDWFEPQMLEKMFYAAEPFEAEIVTCNHRIYSEASKCFVQYSEFPDALRNVGNPFNFKEHPEIPFTGIYPAPWIYLYRRDFIKKMGLQFQVQPRVNDFFFTMSALCASDRIVRVDDQLVNYRTGMSGNLQSGNDKTPLCLISALDAWKSQMENAGTFPVFAERFYERALWESIDALSRFKTFCGFETLYRAAREHFASIEIHSRNKEIEDLFQIFRRTANAGDFLIYLERKALRERDTARLERDRIEIENERNTEKLESALQSRSYRLGFALLHPFRKPPYSKSK